MSSACHVISCHVIVEKEIMICYYVSSPPGWGLGMGLVTSPCKTNLIMETGISMYSIQATVGVIQQHARLKMMPL